MTIACLVNLRFQILSAPFLIEKISMTLAETMIKGIEIQSTLAHLYCIVYCVRAIGGIVGCVWVLYAESGATLLEGVW